jgi:hypothetical protein
MCGDSDGSRKKKKIPSPILPFLTWVKKLSPVLQFLKGMKKGLTGSSVPE